MPEDESPSESIKGGEPTPDQSELQAVLDEASAVEINVSPETASEKEPLAKVEEESKIEVLSGKLYDHPVMRPDATNPAVEGLTREESDRRFEVERNVRRGRAIWRNRDHDSPVVITGVLGWRDNQLFVSIEGSSSGVPVDEIIYSEPTGPEPAPVPDGSVPSITPERPEPVPPRLKPSLELEQPKAEDAETLFSLEQDLEKSRQDYFGAKGSKRAVFSMKAILSDEELRRVGENYESLKDKVVRHKVKIKIAVLKELEEFKNKNQQEKDQEVLALINGVQQEELQKENELILGKDKGKWQKFKEGYNRLNPKLRMAVGAALGVGSVVTAYTGLGGVSAVLVSARTALSGAGAGMTTEAMMASKQEKGKVGAIAKEARKTKTTEQEMTDYLKEQIGRLSPQEVVTELARIRNIGESKGVVEAKQAISYGRMSEMFGVLAKKMKLKKNIKQSTQELTGKSIELLEQKYHENIKTEARAAMQGRELTPEQAVEAYLNKVLEKQQEFNKAQEIQLDQQRRDALKRVIWSTVTGTVTAGVTAFTGLVRLDKIQAAQEAEKLSQAATEVKVPSVSMEKINPDLYTVKAGEGIETKGIQQILDNPKKFGFIGELGNKAEVQSFANKLAHEAAFNTKIGDSAVVGTTKAGEVYDLRLKSSAIGEQIELKQAADGKWHYEFGKGLNKDDIYQQVEKMTVEQPMESPIHKVASTEWQKAEFALWPDKEISWREALPNELPPGENLSDISMRAVDINGDGQVDTYFLYDTDDHQVIDQVVLASGETNVQLLEQAQTMYQQVGQEAKALEQIIGETGKSWDTGDKIIFSRGLGAEFKNGAFDESSAAILKQAVDKLGQQAPEFMRDHNLAEYIKSHLNQVSCEQIEKMHGQGATLYQAGWKRVDYNYVDEMVKHNRVTDGIKLQTKLLSPATNKNLAVEFIDKNKFDANTVAQTYELGKSAQTELADYVKLLKSRFEIIPAATNHSLVERFLSLDTKTALASFKGSYGGEQQVMIDKLYQELDTTLGHKLSQGTLSGTIGENLDRLALSKTNAQALIEKAELLEKQFQAEELIGKAEQMLK